MVPEAPIVKVPLFTKVLVIAPASILTVPFTVPVEAALSVKVVNLVLAPLPSRSVAPEATLKLFDTNMSILPLPAKVT